MDMVEASLTDEGKRRLAELREVRADQSLPLLPLAALRGEAGGHLTHILQNRPDIHRGTLLSSIQPILKSVV
jgi:hypothetical protein